MHLHASVKLGNSLTFLTDWGAGWLAKSFKNNLLFREINNNYNKHKETQGDAMLSSGSLFECCHCWLRQNQVPLTSSRKFITTCQPWVSHFYNNTLGFQTTQMTDFYCSFLKHSSLMWHFHYVTSWKCHINYERPTGRKTQYCMGRRWENRYRDPL